MTSTRTVLVTGANGFIGRRLCAALAPNVRVRALLRGNADGPWHEAVTADMTAGTDDDVTRGIDTIFHLAARTHATDEVDADESLYRAINVDATRALLESAKRSGVARMVFTSSVKALGEGGDDVIDDDTAPAPASAYGRTKLAAERLVLEGGFTPEAVVLRPCLVYGPGVKGNILRMIEAINAGRFPPVPQTGNRRSMVHADDVVTAMIAAAASPGAVGRAFIVSDGRYYSTRDIYESICRGLERPVRSGLPRGVFRALALAGDAAAAVSRRRAPFDGEAYGKLFGSAAYDGRALWNTLNLAPEWTLERALPAIIASWQGQ